MNAAALRKSLPDYLRHALQVVLFNSCLWLLQVASGMERWGHWDRTMVYTQAIGLSIWAFIEFGRIPMMGERDVHWPALPRAIVVVVGGVVGGFIVGSLIGDWYSGLPMLDFLRAPANKMRSALMFTAMAAALATFFFYSRGKAAVQQEKLARVERDATLARLALLHSQLEPHMLFNTLANLRVLITLDPPRAQAMLDRLIAFLRATLTASRTEAHSLAAEFERLDDYLQLMAVRMGARLQTDLQLPDALRSVQVPPLLLQPLVENAIQHGLEPKVEGGRIALRAELASARLVLSVRDTGVGLSAAPPSNGTRFGLRQVRERLHTLYGAAATLTLEPAPDADGGVLARITLPLPSPSP